MADITPEQPDGRAGPPETAPARVALTSDEVEEVREILRERVALKAAPGTPPFGSGEMAGVEVFHDGAPSAIDFVSHVRGSPGIVVDAAVARESPCIAFELGKGRLVFSKGIVGALDEQQQALFCPSVEVREPTPKQKARLAAFRASADVCKAQIADIPKGEELAPWLSCMAKELRAREQEL